jgi:hypothetical protein
MIADEHSEIHYTLAMTPRGWRIDDVRSKSTPSLRAFLTGPYCR